MSPVQKGHLWWLYLSMHTPMMKKMLQCLHYFLENCHHRKVLMVSSYSRRKEPIFHKVCIKGSCSNRSLSVTFFSSHFLDTSVEMSPRFGFKRNWIHSGGICSELSMRQALFPRGCPPLGAKETENKQINLQWNVRFWQCWGWGWATSFITMQIGLHRRILSGSWKPSSSLCLFFF